MGIYFLLFIIFVFLLNLGTITISLIVDILSIIKHIYPAIVILTIIGIIYGIFFDNEYDTKEKIKVVISGIIIIIIFTFMKNI